MTLENRIYHQRMKKQLVSQSRYLSSLPPFVFILEEVENYKGQAGSMCPELQDLRR